MTDEIHETETQSLTLNEFIRSEESKHQGATGELTSILLSIALGSKILSRGVNRAGLAAMLGLSGRKNVQGEEVQKLDEYSDSVFSRILGRTGEFISMVSEEREQLFLPKEGGAKSKYIIAFDPLDGSSNIDVNVSIGSIWGAYERLSDGTQTDESDMSDFLQPGSRQVAAGYTIYGSSTVFVFTTGNGVFGFTLDPTIGEFILTHENMKIPSTGKIYSCNEGNYPGWPDGVKNYIDHVKSSPDGKKYSARYVGSLVADFHRTMLKGGIFLYPGDDKNPNGKLRHLYECAPLALIAEQAGGKSSTGAGRTLDMTPDNIHQRAPLFIGSAEMVDELDRCVAAL